MIKRWAKFRVIEADALGATDQEEEPIICYIRPESVEAVCEVPDFNCCILARRDDLPTLYVTGEAWEILRELDNE